MQESVNQPNSNNSLNTKSVSLFISNCYIKDVAENIIQYMDKKHFAMIEKQDNENILALRFRTSSITQLIFVPEMGYDFMDIILYQQEKGIQIVITSRTPSYNNMADNFLYWFAYGIYQVLGIKPKQHQSNVDNVLNFLKIQYASNITSLQ